MTRAKPPWSTTPWSPNWRSRGGPRLGTQGRCLVQGLFAGQRRVLEEMGVQQSESVGQRDEEAGPSGSWPCPWS